jgi:hypothetical protein
MCASRKAATIRGIQGDSRVQSWAITPKRTRFFPANIHRGTSSNIQVSCLAASVETCGWGGGETLSEDQFSRVSAPRAARSTIAHSGAETRESMLGKRCNDIRDRPLENDTPGLLGSLRIPLLGPDGGCGENHPAPPLKRVTCVSPNRSWLEAEIFDVRAGGKNAARRLFCYSDLATCSACCWCPWKIFNPVCSNSFSSGLLAEGMSVFSSAPFTVLW